MMELLLPLEIEDEILSWKEDKDLKNISQTCKRWRKKCCPRLHGTIFSKDVEFYSLNDHLLEYVEKIIFDSEDSRISEREYSERITLLSLFPNVLEGEIRMSVDSTVEDLDIILYTCWNISLFKVSIDFSKKSDTILKSMLSTFSEKREDLFIVLDLKVPDRVIKDFLNKYEEVIQEYT